MPIADFDLSVEEKLYQFLENPRPELMRTLENIYSLGNEIYTLVELAAFFGYLDALRVLFNQHPIAPLTENAYLDAFRMGSSSQNWAIVDEVMARLKPKQHKKAFAMTIAEHHHQTIHYLLYSKYANNFIKHFGLKLLLWSTTHLQEDDFLYLIQQRFVAEQAERLDNQAIKNAMRVGSQLMIEHLMALDSVQSTLTISTVFKLLQQCFSTGHTDCIPFFAERLPLYLQKKLACHQNELLKLSVKYGHINTFQYLITFEQVRILFTRDAQLYLHLALENAHLPMAEILLALEPVKVLAHTYHNKALRLAISKNMQDLAKDLLFLPKVKKHIKDNDFQVFWDAFHHAKLFILNVFFKIPALQKYVQRLPQKRHPLVLAALLGDMDLSRLFLAHEAFVHQAFFGPKNPLVCAAEAGNIELFEEIMSLETIASSVILKSVRIIFRAAINNNQEGMILYLLQLRMFEDYFKDNYLELFILAVEKRQRKVLKAFELIVKPLVSPYNFNIDYLEGEVGDEHFVSPYLETAMQELKNDEIQGLTDLLDYYAEALSAKPLGDYVKELRDKLAERYLQSPINVQAGDGQLICLPLEYEQFLWIKNDFSHETQLKCYKAYYEHPIHSAWRYLSRPNPWLSPKAQFVIEDETGRYADFEKETTLLISIWLAAQDETFQPPLDLKMSVDEREELFFTGLAGINRSNNLYNHGQDSDGDKPSCPMGVKNLLIHSLVGHPMMIILTESYVKSEILSFLNVFWKECLMKVCKQDIVKMAELWDKVVLRREACQPRTVSEFNDLLAMFNLEHRDVQRFYQYMHDTFADKWACNQKLHAFVEKFLNLEQPPFSTHAEKFGLYFNRFIEAEAQKIEQEMLSLRRYPMGFFSSQQGGLSPSSKSQSPRI